MAHKGLPNKKIRCVRSTSSHVRPDRLARTKMTIPFEFPCNARPVHRLVHEDDAPVAPSSSRSSKAVHQPIAK